MVGPVDIPQRDLAARLRYNPHANRLPCVPSFNSAVFTNLAILLSFPNGIETIERTVNDALRRVNAQNKLRQGAATPSTRHFLQPIRQAPGGRKDTRRDNLRRFQPFQFRHYPLQR